MMITDMADSSKSLHRLRRIGIVLLLTTLPLFVMSCTIEKSVSLFDPNYQSKPDPVISSISPSFGLAGVTRVTIKGLNFSGIKEENLVYFDAERAAVLSATSAQLEVSAPLLIKDFIRVRVSVLGAERFSNTVFYRLDAAVEEMKGISIAEEPWGTAVDAVGNIYVSMLSDGRGVGVKKFTPDGKKSDYVSTRFETKYQSLKFGPDGALYGAWNIRALARIAGENATPELWVSFLTGTKIYDFAFDAAGNIWAVGDNAAFYSVKVDKSIRSFPLQANIKSVRVFNNYLYLAGKTYADNLERVIRFRIFSADSLGPRENYFDFSSSVVGSPGKSIYTIAFTSQGSLLVGTDLSDPLIEVRTDGSVGPFYPRLLSPTIHLLVWGKGTQLLAVIGSASAGAVSSSNKILKI
ncbi:MAG: hypothetical protein FJ217_15750, partial [Ignavibacteria bacterium]|nr:hypothetical protein [Ignavibacteria bacterium]